MGFWDRIRGSHNKAEPAISKVESPPCAHASLVPHWDRAEDMGLRDKVTRYTCDGCQEQFSPEEGVQLRAATAERLRLADAERLRQRGGSSPA